MMGLTGDSLRYSCDEGHNTYVREKERKGSHISETSLFLQATGKHICRHSMRSYK